MSEGLHDIESRGDCERLVRAFYGRALEDPIIGFIFVDVAKLDLDAHIPQITSFWETILLGARSYAGGGVPSARHAHRVAQAFLQRLQDLPSQAGPASMTTGLAVTRHGPRAR